MIFDKRRALIRRRRPRFVYAVGVAKFGKQNELTQGMNISEILM